jgi:hypothetical protein
MRKIVSSVMWWLFGVILLGLLGGIALVVFLSAQNQRHIPPCEAMRPYLLYHGTYYFEQPGADLPSSDRGDLVTTIGSGKSQVQSCLAAGTAVYSVKGRPIATDLALDNGDGLLLFEVPAATPTPSASPTGLAWMPQFADTSVVKSLDPGPGRPRAT